MLFPDDQKIDYDIQVGDLVVVLQNTDLLLSTVYSDQICIVVEVYPSPSSAIFNFELRIITAEGHLVDVWFHEVKKLRDPNVE